MKQTIIRLRLVIAKTLIRPKRPTRKGEIPMFCFPTTRWLCNPLLLTSLFLSLSFTAATSLAQIGKLREDAPNALSSQASFTKSLKILQRTRPNLVTKFGGLPREASAGAPLGNELSVQAGNIGGWVAGGTLGSGGEAGGYLIDLVLSRTPVSSSAYATYSSNYSDGVLLRGGRIGRTGDLAAGAARLYTDELRGSVVVPSDTPAGTYYFCAIIDAGNRIVESNEADNVACQQIRIIGRERPRPSARFRVTLNGFFVDHETADHAFEVDGKRDEVYIVADVAEFDDAGRITSRTRPQSVVMGDINNQTHPPRINAGRASALGGLRTGDPFPTPEPWRRTGETSTQQPPMLLWEGTLAKGSRAVVIVPTIWEWDGPGGILADYRTSMNSTLARYVRSLNTNEADLNNLIAIVTGGPGARRPVGFEPTGNAADRPIGIEVRPGFFFSADENQVGLEWFTPKRILLTYDLAVQAVASTRDGLGPGIFKLAYRDHPDLEGVYTLYLQIEPVP
jgi:hypothetical protein